jgi:hypothetical protein
MALESKEGEEQAAGGNSHRRYTRVSYRDLNAQVVLYLMN